MLNKVIIFIIWPFASLVYSVKWAGRRQFNIILFLFIVFFSFCVYYSGSESFDGDIVRNLNTAISFADANWKDIIYEADYYIPVIGRVFGSFFPNERFILFILSIIYSFLFVKSVSIVLNKYDFDSKSLDQQILIWAVVLSVPIILINSIRFSTAMLISLWAILEILINKRYYFYFLFILCPLIHFSFWIILPFPILYLIIRNNLSIAIVIFIASFVYSTSTTSYRVNELSQEYTSESIYNRVKQYSQEDNRERLINEYDIAAERGSDLRFINRSIKVYSNILIMLLLMLLIALNFKTIIINKQLVPIFVIILLSYSLANIASSVSNGDRFYHLAIAVCALLVYFMKYNLSLTNVNISYFMKNNSYILNSILIIVIISGINLIYGSRIMFSSFNLFIGNIFTAVFLI